MFRQPRPSTLAFGWLLVMALAPLLLWHDVLGSILSSFRLTPTYLLGELSPWVLLIVGVGFLVPVALSVGRDPESRLYPRARRAYTTWGTVIYLLGIILAVEVAEVWQYAH